MVLDTLLREHADGADLAAMQTGCHYDYTNQAWRDGHDHAHMTSDDSPLTFCGADAATCRRGNPEMWGAA
jgi:hypothetical protein